MGALSLLYKPGLTKSAPDYKDVRISFRFTKTQISEMTSALLALQEATKAMMVTDFASEFRT